MNYNCKICNKNYKTYQTLWKHNKEFHSSVVADSNTTENNILKCRYCNKLFKHKQNKYEHEKNVCIPKNKLSDNTKQTELLLQIKKEEARILELQLKMQKSKKDEGMTVKKINKLLEKKLNKKNMEASSQTEQSTAYDYISDFGKEDVVETLTKQEKRIIMNAKYSSLEKLIEIVHCGKYNQFKNIIITNMKDNYMYKYDNKLGHFVLSSKLDVLNSLINYRLDDLEVIYNDLLVKNKLDEKTKECIEKFINKINYDENKYIDYDGKQHENYKQYKINEIKVLLFNNHDKITNDISLLLTTENI